MMMTRSREEKYWTDIESTMKAAVADLEARCRMILATARIPQEESEAFELALLNFRRGFNGLAWTIEPMREHYPEQLRTAYQMLFVLMRTAMQLGASHLFADAARDFYKTEHARWSGAKGGVKTGEKRRKQREEGWEPIARETIRELRKAHPDWSQDQIAVKVVGEWKLEDSQAPGHRSLTNLIGAMEKSGDLPKKRR